MVTVWLMLLVVVLVVASTLALVVALVVAATVMPVTQGWDKDWTTERRTPYKYAEGGAGGKAGLALRRDMPRRAASRRAAPR